MPYDVRWTIRATKQARRIPRDERRRIVSAVGELADWPACRERQDIKPLRNHAYQYRLRVGRYRVLFDVESGLRVVSIEEVRKRDERTY